MANWCKNKVTFTGSEKGLNQVMNLFKAMIEKESGGAVGQKPDFLDNDGGYFFEIDLNENKYCSFNYESRWSPNTESLWLIANHFNIGFVLDYEESGCMVYGKTIYENENLQNYFLNQCDFKDCKHNEETDNYSFEDKQYDYLDDIMKILLERKIDKSNQKIA